MENSKKKAIIVVGKKGHGKSTFIKMFLDNSEKQKIQIEGCDQSVMSKCTLYRVHTRNFTINEQLYIIDTPRLDSEQSIILVLEQLDICIVQNRCEIIGLIYVLDIANININQDKDSFFKFYENFKLRHSIEKQILFCVLSKFDKYHQQQGKYSDKINIFKKVCEINGLEKSWNKNIKWMSQSLKQTQKFLKITNPKNNHDAYQIYQKQWRKLKQNITNVIINKKYLPFDKYIDDLQTFNLLVTKSLQKVIFNSKQTVLQQLQYQTYVEKKKTQTKTVGTVIAGNFFAKVIAKKLGPLTLLGKAAVIGGMFVASELYSYFKNQYTYVKEKISQDYITQKKNVLIQERIRHCQLKKLDELITFQQNKILIKKSSLFNRIISGSIYNYLQKYKITLDFQESYKQFKEKIETRKLCIIFEVRRPTIKESEKFLLQLSSQYYKKL